MLRGILKTLPRPPNAYLFSTSVVSSGRRANVPMDLDPSLRDLLQDVDMAMHTKTRTPPPAHKELEAFEINELGLVESETLAEEEEHISETLRRKSPAAVFGSQSIGAVVLPYELQESIDRLIAAADKPQLRTDAKRLFAQQEDSDSSEQWQPEYSAHYRSRQMKQRHAERDGTAFASVALPAHFAAISSVLRHVKQRLEPTWRPERIFDWGAGTGSGLWASLYAFQDHKDSLYENLKAQNSTVVRYVGMDKREGLTAMGKRLVTDVDIGSTSMSWQKSFHPEDKLAREDAKDTVAMSAFNFSALSTHLQRKAVVKEMWESGAHVIIIIDHNTPAGFEAIAEARQYLLGMGTKEFEDPAADHWPYRGAHVIAPCPHDGDCPLLHPGSIRLVCGFQQRLQRPAFLRRTKHSGIGYEDIGYSYIAVRRGPRPVYHGKKVGRIGEVAREELEKQARASIPMKELVLHDDLTPAPEVEESPESPADVLVDEPQTAAEMDAALRQEAYNWPRMIFTPIKNAGHIILDVCAKEGDIMRMTIPKSQGKQPYYDARKSAWGDLFPHPPKNAPQVRYQPKRTKREGGTNAIRGEDIGKRNDKKRAKKSPNSYEVLTEVMKATRKNKKRPRRQPYDAEDDYSQEYN